MCSLSQEVSIDVEEAFDKIQHHLRKNCQETKNRAELCQPDKGHL